MAELIVITGGSYSGKTALVETLVSRGFVALPEAAYEVIRELTEARGLEEQARWRRANPIDFQRLITRRQHEREQDARREPTPFVFCDRGLLDGRAYCMLDGVDWPEDLRTLGVSARYGRVFVLETLGAFELRLESGRIHTLEESLRVAPLLADVYRAHTRAVTHVPEMPVSDRADLVLRTLGLAPAAP